MINTSFFRALIVFFGVMGSFANARANDLPEDMQGCQNCEAIVELDRAQAHDFAAMLTILSSMPLHGIVLENLSKESTAKVLVATFSDYAANNNIDSFDVAKKLKSFAEDDEWGILSISAMWKPLTDKTK